MAAQLSTQRKAGTCDPIAAFSVDCESGTAGAYLAAAAVANRPMVLMLSVAAAEAMAVL